MFYCESNPRDLKDYVSACALVTQVFAKTRIILRVLLGYHCFAGRGTETSDTKDFQQTSAKCSVFAIHVRNPFREATSKDRRELSFSMADQPSLTTRPATPVDVPALNILIASAYRGEESRKGWTTEADLLTGPRINDAGILAKISDSNNTLLVSMDSSNTILACCEILRRSDELGYFGLFAVNPKRQGGGLGKRVMQAAEDYASEILGLKRLEMSVIWKRVELIAWYVRRGYIVTGEERPFPYELMVDGAGALFDDLHFVILEKKLR